MYIRNRLICCDKTKPNQKTTDFDKYRLIYNVVSVLLFFWDSISRTGKGRNRKAPFCASIRSGSWPRQAEIFLIYLWKNRLILMVFPSGGVFQHLTSHSFHLLALFKRESSVIFQSSSSHNGEGVASGHDFRQKTLCETETTNTFITSTWNWYSAVRLDFARLWSENTQMCWLHAKVIYVTEMHSLCIYSKCWEQKL